MEKVRRLVVEEVAEELSYEKIALIVAIASHVEDRVVPPVVEDSIAEELSYEKIALIVAIATRAEGRVSFLRV